MRQVTLVWATWQSLLSSFAWAFTQREYRRFVEWITALALNVEEHTVTQSVVAIERTADWRPWSPSPSTAPGAPTMSPPP